MLPKLHILRRLNLTLQVVERRGEETTGTAGEVGHGLPQTRMENLHDKISKGTRGVELACVAGRLEVLQDTLVYIAKSMTVFGIGEVNLVHHIHHLTKERAVLHILVEVGKDLLDNPISTRRVLIQIQFLERREELVVDKVQEFVTGEALAIGMIDSPIAPTHRFGNDGDKVFGIIKLPDFFLGIIDLEEEKPCHLFDTLCIARYTGVGTHDVLKTFNEIVYHYAACL